MHDQIPDFATEIIKRLYSGYQYSPSDADHREYAPHYQSLTTHRDYFVRYLAVADMQLSEEDGVFFIEKRSGDLTKEERQTIVVIYLFVDLFLEQGRTPGDMYTQLCNWEKLEWFRDGYGYEYLKQVGITTLDDIHDLWQSLIRRGIVDYNEERRLVTLRRPAERIVQMALRFRQQHYEANHE